MRLILEALRAAVVAMLGAYHSAKYGAIIRRLGLPLVERNERRGFVVVQIDGLAHDCLLQAMERGYAPYLQRLLRRGDVALQPWTVGLPCTTPAVQAGILFGNNDDIPSYRWYDKREGEAIDCVQPAAIYAIQERLARNHPGILRGGSSYMNVFDGDASLSMFTLGAMNRKRFFESVKGLGFLLLFLLSPIRTVKMIVLAVWEYVTDLAQHTSAVLRRSNPRPLQVKFRFLRVVSNVIFREIQTFAVLIDIFRGVPAIYSTYYGYDEVAHQYGPLSKPALRALHAIDGRIRRIDGLRRLMLGRAYDLFILSDHGMTSAIPFRKLHEHTLGEMVHECVDHAMCVAEAQRPVERGALQEAFLAEELEAIERNLGSPWSRIARRIRRAVQPGLNAHNGDGDGPMDARRNAIGDELMVRSSGSLSHIYFADHPAPLDLDQIEALSPRLVRNLAEHPSIWLVLGRQNGAVVLIDKKGRYTLDGNGHSDVSGSDPRILEDKDLDPAVLARLARFSNAGDLIVFGQYDPETDTVICFEDQWACHGGLGGAQRVAFMLTEKHIDWPMAQVRDANDLYGLFARRYRFEPSG